MCEHLCKFSCFESVSHYSIFKDNGVVYSFYFYCPNDASGILKDAASIFNVMDAVGCRLQDTFITDEANLPKSSIF